MLCWVTEELESECLWLARDVYMRCIADHVKPLFVLSFFFSLERCLYTHARSNQSPYQEVYLDIVCIEHLHCCPAGNAQAKCFVYHQKKKENLLHFELYMKRYMERIHALFRVCSLVSAPVHFCIQRVQAKQYRFTIFVNLFSLYFHITLLSSVGELEHIQGKQSFHIHI